MMLTVNYKSNNDGGDTVQDLECYYASLVVL